MGYGECAGIDVELFAEQGGLFVEETVDTVLSYRQIGDLVHDDPLELQEGGVTFSGQSDVVDVEMLLPALDDFSSDSELGRHHDFVVEHDLDPVREPLHLSFLRGLVLGAIVVFLRDSQLTARS